jgi:hypothetical protein
MPNQDYSNCVFINCPFDDEYRPLYHAMIFSIFDCGYVARCARETSDGSQARINRIESIIRESRYGIHDISKTEPDDDTGLPRFNMPLELGLFLGAKYFGQGQQKRKACLILDRAPYRYQSFISDIGGQDIESHEEAPEKLIGKVRDWLSEKSKRRNIPGGREIFRRYEQFCSVLPFMCKEYRRDVDELIFPEYAEMVSLWLDRNAS